MKLMWFIFDKTGSLTIGKPELIGMFSLKDGQKVPLNDEQRKTYLKLAASLSVKSKHPISAALTKSYDGALEDLEIKEKKGFGLETEFCGKTLRLGRKDFCGIGGAFELGGSDFKADCASTWTPQQVRGDSLENTFLRLSPRTCCGVQFFRRRKPANFFYEIW